MHYLLSEICNVDFLGVIVRFGCMVARVGADFVPPIKSDRFHRKKL